ncbi:MULTISPECIES: archaellin/type IV pilin N-terminal domain-containing protein [unclassified Streptomyces]|uniref:archaellin/type IV pilin N-terminal domain-containing protein n=1 Tax=unclassified Streptomyces TaxID=2593676 RepID=UPI0011A646D2|nr:archaellin/type IV pilin N-terminal domain-containing protein [Streptomyces sp. BK340]TVZ90240.1 flagellin-like protein [Streptomyces sp. BK340]
MYALASQPMPAPDSALFDLTWGLGATVTGWVALINPRGILEWIALRRGNGGKVWPGRVAGGVFAVLGPVEAIKGIHHLLALKGAERPTVFHRTSGLSPVLATVMIVAVVLVAVHAWRTNEFLQEAWTAGGLPRTCAVLATLAALLFVAFTVFGFLTAGILCSAAAGVATVGLVLLRGRV